MPDYPIAKPDVEGNTGLLDFSLTIPKLQRTIIELNLALALASLSRFS
jgi:hypothetical protein